MSARPSSAELVEGIRAGRPAARRQLFDCYAPLLRRVLRRELGRDPELPDLLHDVFVAALESLTQLNEPAALTGWLTQIAVNVARGHVRHCVRRRALGDLLSLGADTRRGHLDHAASEASLLVGEVFGRLPAAQRAPFALRFLAGMELSEVAATCTLSIPTVKRRLHAARRRLAQLVPLE